MQTETQHALDNIKQSIELLKRHLNLEEAQTRILKIEETSSAVDFWNDQKNAQNLMREKTILENKIQNIIDENDVLLFMKGTPVMPQCGFSAAVVGVLSHMGIKYNSVNVLEDPEIREGIKEFSDWPTIPQLYVKKEFVGGCDIIREMHENGELTQYFSEAGIST